MGPLKQLQKNKFTQSWLKGYEEMIHLLAQVHRYPLFCFKYMLKKSQEDSNPCSLHDGLLLLMTSTMDVMVAGTYIQKLSSIFM